MSRRQITPVEFEVAQESRSEFSFGWLRLAVPALLLALMLLFVLNASSLHLQTDPSGTSISLEGPWPRIALGDRWLLRSGRYQVEANAPGYQLLSEEIAVQRGGSSTLLTLQPLPGQLSVDVEPSDVRGELFVDGEPWMEFEGDFIAEIPAGERQLLVDGYLYSSWSGSLNIEGYGQHQELSVQLQPRFDQLQLVSMPATAEVDLDGEPLGETPLSVPLEWGSHQLSARAPGYYPLEIALDWTQATDKTLELQLQPLPVDLELVSEPAGATVTLNGEFRGQTPLTLSVTPLQNHQLRLSRAGYRPINEDLQLQLSQNDSKSYQLQPILGRLLARVEPASAELYVNDQLVGRGSQELELPATQQTIRVEAQGYQSQVQQVIPNPEVEQLLSFNLLTVEQAAWAELPERYRTSAGDVMLLFREPGLVQLGSDRSETQRRANEVRWQADLRRALYVAQTQVTNAQYRAFQSDHSSGNFQGFSLDGEDQPVVGVSWQQAALFCNWLSEREGLPPFYQVTRGFVSGVNPEATGYRLMTEAEWVWLSAITPSGLKQKYAWGQDETPSAVENFAAMETSDMINFYLEAYQDDYRVTAPVGRFPANRKGIYDLAGNAAEWIHDWYDPMPYPDDEVQVDPLGPEIGEYHVIRGASWARGYQPQLRLAYRDYGATARNDVGFRVVRYAQP